MQIRQVIAQDILACSRIEQACFSVAEAATHERIALRQQAFSQGFLVAEIGHDLVGMINCGATDDVDLADENFKALIGHKADGKNWVIFSLAVLPGFQKKGIGSQLLRSLISQARGEKASGISLLCKSNLIRFYEGFGFENLGTSSSQHGGVSWWEMRYLLSD